MYFTLLNKLKSSCQNVKMYVTKSIDLLSRNSKHLDFNFLDFPTILYVFLKLTAIELKT